MTTGVYNIVLAVTAYNRTALGGRVPNDCQTYRAVDKGHRRRESREITVSGELIGYSAWPGHEQVFKLDRRRVGVKSGEEARETVYGLTSLSAAQARPNAYSTCHEPIGASRTVCTVVRT